MERYVAALGCKVGREKKRCEDCTNNPPKYELTGSILEKYLELIANGQVILIERFFDELSGSGVGGECPDTGAERYLIGSVRKIIDVQKT